MNTTVFLTVDQVVDIAARNWHCLVGDFNVVAGAVERCRASAGGLDAFPTLWDKAYALLHGLSSTQGFVDGNKRTAWTAMETFLALNGVFIAVQTIQADVFVRAVALNAIDQELAVEWLQAHRRRD